MDRARELRENAERCLRLSRSINSPADVAWLEDLAAEASEAADRLEANKPAGSEGHNSFSQQRDVLGRDGSDVSASPTENPGSGMFPDRRRSGRSEVSAVLIPLLRSDSLANIPFDPADDGPDQLNASRGIFIWTLASVVVWGPLLWWMW